MNGEPEPGSCHGRHKEAAVTVHAAQVRLFAGSLPSRLVMTHLPPSVITHLLSLTPSEYHLRPGLRGLAGAVCYLGRGTRTGGRRGRRPRRPPTSRRIAYLRRAHVILAR